MRINDDREILWSLRLWLIRLLAGKATIVYNATIIDGRVSLNLQHGMWIGKSEIKRT